jgi:hypothetical protein
MANYKKTEDLANSVQSMTNSLNIGGSFAGTIGGGKAERQERKKIKVGIRSGLKEIRKSGALDANALDASGTPTDPDAYRAAYDKKQDLLKQKADVKGYSTKRRVNVGHRKDVNLLDEPIQAVTKEGESLQHSIDSPYHGQQLNISTIHKDQRSGGGNYGVDPTKESKNYTNVYKKGEYSHSVPFERPGVPSGSMGPGPSPDRPDITPLPKWDPKKEKGKLGAKPKKTRVVQNKLKQERVKKYAPLKTTVANLFGNPTIQYKQGRAKTRDRKNDLYSNTRSKKREWKKDYKEARKSYKKGRREDIAAQKADFRQDRRDWIKSIFTG